MLKQISNAELDSIVKSLGHDLPGLYRNVLIEEGFGEFDDFRIYHPSEIVGLYEHHFEDSADLFSRWFPFGCNERLQEIWVIDPKSETAASIWHETHPDDYEEEEWLPYEVWIDRYFPHE